MTDTIELGSEKQFSACPVNHLPAKLDFEACIRVIESVDPDLTAADIKASAQPLALDHVDTLLEYTGLSLSDKMRFKFALERHGLLARGKRVY